MLESLADHLICPSCEAAVTVAEREQQENAEILSGILTCHGCGKQFPIASGVPHMEIGDPATAQDHVADSFGFEWNLYHEGELETGDVLWGRKLEDEVATFCETLEVNPETLKGKWVLDAGCGSGFMTVELARRFPETVFVGLDINPSLARLFSKAREYPNLRIVQGSLFNIPFADETFDYIWSNGVIHHTGDTRRAFDPLTRKLKAGGRIYVWVYQKKLSPMVALRLALLPLGLTAWNHAFLLRFCKVVAVPTWLAVKFLALVGRIPITQRFTHARILLRRRSFKELVLTWFDVLSPRYRDTYTKKEFEGWFVENGYREIRQYWYPVGVSGTKG